MKHLIICREYPPAPSGGIGTYVAHISRLLAEHGETVHVIGQLWKGAEQEVEERCLGRLIIHRVPLDRRTIRGIRPHPAIHSGILKGLYESAYYPQCFSWQAGILAERLVEQEGIDIIEAQEYEAPLYYLQLRRALGLGVKRQPPCIIHMHSPTELAIQYNELSVGTPYFLTAKRLEDYSISAADGLLCPSRFLARQAERHYGLKAGSVHVVPYPIGDNPVLERDKETWERGTICYVGRLEGRKGVIEWIDAAVSVAYQYPATRFEFVGANILGTPWMSGQELLQCRIPRDLQARFLFRGPQRRSSIPQFLRGARIAVVPSRWENFPNTCIEAMCSGLPVIASREGGMVEMIEDRRTGWLAAKPGVEGLAEALRRALETPAQEIAKMGQEAARDIRRMCDNEKILKSQLNFRSALTNQNPGNSSRLPTNLPSNKNPFLRSTEHRTPHHGSSESLAIVITCVNGGSFLGRCLQSLEKQTKRPAAVVVVDDRLDDKLKLKEVERASKGGWKMIQKPWASHASLKNDAIEGVLRSGVAPLGFALLNAEDRVEPDFIAKCELVLRKCPEVGLVSFWTRYSNAKDRICIKPCPSFPYQWLWNEVSPSSVVRTEAFREAGPYRATMKQGYEDWDLFNAVMAAGWVAVTVPEILGEHRFATSDAHFSEQMHRELLTRFPNLLAQDAKEIVLLAQVAMMQGMSCHPRKIASWVLGRATAKIRRLAPSPLLHLVSHLKRKWQRRLAREFIRS